MHRIVKEPLSLKAVNMIDPITELFEITQYNGKKTMVIYKLGGNYMDVHIYLYSRYHL